LEKGPPTRSLFSAPSGAASVQQLHFKPASLGGFLTASIIVGWIEQFDFFTLKNLKAFKKFPVFLAA
jgi:hypothetical protein